MSSEFSMVLAKKLKSLRSSVHMTQDDVAELLGMNRTSFSKYENGAANPPLAVLRKLAKLYDVQLEYLIYDDPRKLLLESNDTGEMPDDSDINNISAFFSKLTRDERMIILKLRLLKDDEKRRIINEIDSNFENGD